MNTVGANIALYLMKEVPTLSKLFVLNFNKVFLLVGLLVMFVFTGARAANETGESQKAIDECIEGATTKAYPNGNVTVPESVNTVKLTNCVSKEIAKLKKRRAEKSCNEACKEEIDDFKNTVLANTSMPEDRAETKRQAMCDAIYDSERDSINECKKLDMKKANSCAKSQPDEDGFMNSETMQMATPFLGMVSGADTLMGVYSAMNDKPGCRLSKADFKDEKQSLNDQKKDLEEKIKKNMEDAETAQSEYAQKLKDWAKEEGEIADRLEAIPGETADNKDKLDGEKVKTKMQADSKYNAVVDQMGELRRKYNDMVDAKSVALSENSDFVIHDRCSEIAVGNDPSKQKAASPQPSQTVQNSFSGAFAQGKVISSNIQKRYDACMDRERKKQKRVENTFASELTAIKAKLQSYDTMLGQINEEKRMAEQEINKQIAKLAESADKEIKKLAREYQRIQTDKTNEQSLLKQKLERFASENKKNQQQLAILGMKLSAFAGKQPPKTNDDKSMNDMLDQCGANFLDMLGNFKEKCCQSGNYTGTGSATCKFTSVDFEADMEKKSAKQRRADRAKQNETWKKQGATK